MTDAPSPRCSSGSDVPEGATHLRQPEYVEAWLFNGLSPTPLWLLAKYKDFPLPEAMKGRYALALDREFWRWMDVDQFDRFFVPIPGVAQRPVSCGQDTIRTAAKALDYLADHTRPAGGQETYNAEHLIQIAYELREIANASPPAALPAETVTVPLEALRNCGCPADFRGTIGQCEDSGQCGCSINLKGRAVSSTDRVVPPADRGTGDQR